MPRETFIVADRLFDGVTLSTGIAVAVEGQTISRLIPVAEVPEGSDVLRLEGTTLSPGLIDAHVHMAPWMVFGLLAAGITTVRDLGNNIDVVTEMLGALPDVPRPTIHWSGPLLEGDLVNWPSVARSHDSEAGIRATVDELANRGGRTIKLYANATPPLVAVAANQAHRHGMRVLGHAGATTFTEMVAAQVDEAQHLAGCLAADLGYDNWADSARALAREPIDHCTTLVVWDTMTHLGRPQSVRDSAMKWVHPQALVAWSEAHHATQSSVERNKRSRDLLERMAIIPFLLEAGRGVLVGSDTPFPGLVPGSSLHDEAGLLVESGMSPMDVMRAMTSGNAALMDIPDAGRIAVGKTADMVAFDGNPTGRIADLSRVRGVWRAGERVSIEKLAAAAKETFAEDTDSPVDRIGDLHYVPATMAR